MLFNSFEFLIFFLAVTSLFFLLPHRARWSLLLLASCFFYMFFKPEYIFILAFTIVIDYFAGLWIEQAKNERRRKLFLIASLVANIGVLALFKYYNFINDQVTGIATVLGYSNHIPYLSIVLPIGLSFHTFQAMSYTIEVFRKNQQAERHFGIYALYVMFYPQLVAGPIERPQNILHQFHEKKIFRYENLVSGIKRISWGLFKKVVIADRLALMVDTVYKDPSQWHGTAILLTIVLFGIQIYCDFSGYSDIALGTAKVMGYNLMENFNYPFRSKNITEFWRRWHISLSTWFNDYVFTPLVISKRDWGTIGVIFSLFITFFISGLWHGAAWTFVVFGVLHGTAVIFEFATKKKRKKIAKAIPGWLYNNGSMMLTFLYACLAWIFFRASSIQQAGVMIRNLFTPDESGNYFSLGKPDIHGLPSSFMGLPFWQFCLSMSLIPFLFFSEWLFSYKNESRFNEMPRTVRWATYYLIAFSIILFGVFNTKQFIYFQF
jgi:alginate O-acetyltransferase complex protein AlgI